MTDYKKSLHNIMLLMPKLDHTGKYNEDFNNLKSLVNKSTPKKIRWWREEGDGLLVFYAIECPACEYSFSDEEIDRQISYCPECGQCLEWSAEDN